MEHALLYSQSLEVSRHTWESLEEVCDEAATQSLAEKFVHELEKMHFPLQELGLEEAIDAGFRYAADDHGGSAMRLEVALTTVARRVDLALNDDSAPWWKTLDGFRKEWLLPLWHASTYFHILAVNDVGQSSEHYLATSLSGLQSTCEMAKTNWAESNDPVALWFDRAATRCSDAAITAAEWARRMDRHKAGLHQILAILDEVFVALDQAFECFLSSNSTRDSDLVLATQLQCESLTNVVHVAEQFFSARAPDLEGELKEKVRRLASITRKLDRYQLQARSKNYDEQNKALLTRLTQEATREVQYVGWCHRDRRIRLFKGSPVVPLGWEPGLEFLEMRPGSTARNLELEFPRAFSSELIAHFVQIIRHAMPDPPSPID